jgi:hypothetical protein
MSDPMSSHEIEDVLSSIRRLVSEDLRPGAVRSRIPVDNDAHRAEARLILTPALRVIQQAAAEAATQPDALAQNADWEFEALVPEVTEESDAALAAKPASPPVTEDLRNDRLRAAATIAFPSASASLAGQFQSRRGDVELLADDEDDLPVTPAKEPPSDVMIWDDDAFDEASLQARRQELMLDAEDEADLLSGSAGPKDGEGAESLSGEIIEAAPWAPMWSDVPEQGAAWNEVETAWEGSAEGGATAEDAAEEAQPAIVPARMRLVENPLARAWAERLEETLRAELNAEFRELEETVAKEAVAEEVAVETDPAPAQEPVPDEAFAETLQPEEPEAPIAGLRSASDDRVEAEVAEDLRQIDEDLLRELVREVLREELAGALGERITRNVRKLVRMEINRTLSAGEFQ